MAWNRTGTVTVTLNSVTVTGVGTVFLQESRVGDGFRGPDGGLYEVSNIVSNTQLTLAKQYKGPTLATQPFDIIPVQGYQQKSADELRAFVNKYGAFLDSKGLYAMSLVAPAADRLFYFTGADTGALAPFTAKARELVAATTEAAMRTALGLGTSAVLAVTTSQTDLTANRVLKTSDFGIGSAMTLNAGSDLNLLTQPGEYAYTSGSPPLVNCPITSAVYVTVKGRSAYPLQEVVAVYGTVKYWRTSKVANPTVAAADWNEWTFEEASYAMPWLGDCNDIKQNGRYLTNPTATNQPPGFTGGGAQGYLDHFQAQNTQYARQIWDQISLNRKFVRFKVANVWQGWNELINAGDFGVGVGSGVKLDSFLTDNKSGLYYAFGAGNSGATPGAPPGSGNLSLTVVAVKGFANASYMTYIVTEVASTTLVKTWIGTKITASAAPAWKEITFGGDYGVGVPAGTSGVNITDFAVRLPSGMYRGVFANVANSPPGFLAGSGFTCISMAYIGNVSMYLVTGANKAWIGYYGAGTTVAWVDLITAQDSGVGLLHSPPVITNFASPVASGEYRCLGSATNSPAELGATTAASVLVGKGWTDEGFTTFLVTELASSAAPRVWAGLRTVAGGVPRWRQVLQMGDLGLGGHSGLETTLRPWQGNSFRGWATTAPDSPMGTNSVGLDMGYQENRRMQIAMSTSNLFMSRYTDDASGNAGWRMHYTTENVVGTVSADGPIRAIIESGTNANGKYTKFADGTLIQEIVRTDIQAIDTAFNGGFIGAVLYWTFPVPFAAIGDVGYPAVTISARGGGRLTFPMPNGYANATNFSYFHAALLTQGSNNIPMSAIAKGRWRI